MISFTEKLVEACVAASPATFLPFAASVDHRQPKLGGFIPDLILSREGEPLILEIQLHALDRNHLYRLLEYRDLYEDVYGVQPELMLMAEIVPDRFKPLLRTHKIETISFDRHEFLKLALDACADVIVPHVLSGASGGRDEPDSDDEPSATSSAEIEPLRWSPSMSAPEVEAFFERQIGALGLSRHELPLPYQRSVHGDLRRAYRDPVVQAIQTMYRPRDWDWGRLLSEPGHMGRRTLSKPRIGIGCHITQKGNFSAYFYDPDEREESSWSLPPRGSSYGWSRPDDEILFVRDVTHLDARPDHKRRYGQADWSGLDSILIGWLKAAYDDIIDAARVIYDVEVQSDIFLDTENLSGKADWRQRESIIGWRISNSHEEKRKAAEVRLLSLRQTHGIDIDTFVDVYARHIGVKSRGVLAPAHVVRALTAAGAEMDAKDIRETLAQLRLVEPADYAKARPSDAINRRPSSAPR